ncbi:MAG: TolC family protein [Taibaiella sp.]|nr:TolC family protein [Taibaiella sp.]
MRKVYIALFSAIIATTSTQAQTPVRLSLNDCIAYALQNNYSVKNAHIDMLIQEAQVKQTTSAALPHINGKADFSYANIVPSQFIDASTFPSGGIVVPKGTIVPLQFSLPYSASANVTTSQVLFDGSVIVALQARNTVMDMARQSEKVTQESVRYNIYKAYNSLVIAYKQFDIIKSSLVLARSMESDLVKTRNAGFAEKIDVDRTSVQINNLATDSMKVGNMLTVAEQVLKYNLGMDINTPIILTDTDVEKGRESGMALITEKENYERVPEYNVLMTALKLNEFDLKRYKLSALPSLSGFWSYGSNYGNDKLENIFKFDSYMPSSIFGFALNAPIFNGFVRQHQVREARLKIEKTKNNIEFTKQSIDFQAATARTTLKNSLLQVQSQKRNLELSNTVLDLAQKKYKAGVGSNLEVTTAQTDLLRSQNNYFSALLEVINAEADLKKALGLLK